MGLKKHGSILIILIDHKDKATEIMFSLCYVVKNNNMAISLFTIMIKQVKSFVLFFSVVWHLVRVSYQ